MDASISGKQVALLSGCDRNKDQSYFLSGVRSNALQKVDYFPCSTGLTFSRQYFRLVIFKSLKLGNWPHPMVCAPHLEKIVMEFALWGRDLSQV